MLKSPNAARSSRNPHDDTAITAAPPRRWGIDALTVINRITQDPVDLGLLTAALAIELDERPLDRDTALRLEPVPEPRFDGMQWILTVNAAHTLTRRRFSIAHAIGHLALHPTLIGKGLADTSEYRCPQDGPYWNPGLTAQRETEANQLAVGLLMPKQAVRRRHAEYPDLTSLAAHFQVSTRAMQIRLDALDLPIPPVRSLVAAAR